MIKILIYNQYCLLSISGVDHLEAICHTYVTINYEMYQILIGLWDPFKVSTLSKI